MQLCFKRCIRCLVDESWVTEEAAQFAVDVIAYALGISSTEIPQAAINAPSPSQNQELELVKGAFVPNGTELMTLFSQYQVIGYKAFAAEQSLKELSLPQNIKKIKPKAFLDCVNLRQVTLPPTIDEIGLGAFSGCDALETISLERNANYTVVFIQPKGLFCYILPAGKHRNRRPGTVYGVFFSRTASPYGYFDYL